jgi:Bromodomain
MSDSRRSFASASSRDEALRRINKIVNSFLAKEELTPFREPVDWRSLELFDYPEIIKRQVDLGTIKRRLERNQYSCAAEVAHDIRLVWRNCMQ